MYNNSVHFHTASPYCRWENRLQSLLGLLKGSTDITNFYEWVTAFLDVAPECLCFLLTFVEIRNKNTA